MLAPLVRSANFRGLLGLSHRSARRILSIATILTAAVLGSMAWAAPDDRAFRNWGAPFEADFRARAAFWDQTNAVLETPDRRYVFVPVEQLSPEDRAYLASFPRPQIFRDRLRWGATELAREIPKMPVDGFSGRVIAFNGRQFLVAVRNDRISDTLHPPSMLDAASLKTLMDLYADELNPDERILAAAATHEALWIPDAENAATILAPGQFDDLLPAGASLIAYDGFWLVYKDPPTAEGEPGALRTMRVSEADANAAKLRDFLLEKFVAEARFIPGRADPSLMRALLRKERLTSAAVGQQGIFPGASSRSGSPLMARWIYRDPTGSVVLLSDGTLEVVAATEHDAKRYESIDAGTRPVEVMTGEAAQPLPWREWSSLPEVAREARPVAWASDTLFVQIRDGSFRRFDRAALDATDAAYLADLAEPPYDKRIMRLATTPAVEAYPGVPTGLVNVTVAAFNGREALCVSPDGTLHGTPFPALAFDLRSRKIFLARCAGRMDADDWIRAAGVVRQAIWREADGSPLPLNEFGNAARGFAVAFDGEALVLEGPADEDDSIARLAGYRLLNVSAPASDDQRRLLETLQRRSDEESRPLASAEPLVRKAFASKGRGETAALGELRLWTGRLLRSVGSTEARLVSRNDRSCAVLLEDGTLDVLLGLSEADADYLNQVEGFLSPRVDRSQPIVYRPFDAGKLDEELRRMAARRWTTAQLESVPAEALAWDADRVYLRRDDGKFATLPIAELSPEDRAWLESKPRPQFDVPTERWIPKAAPPVASDAQNEPQAPPLPDRPTEPFDGAPIAFNGRAVIFVRPGGKLPELWTDFAALSPESQRTILERFDATMDDRARFVAAWRMGCALWVDDASQKRETFGADVPLPILPEIDRAIAYDGQNLLLLLRRPPGVEGRMSRPNLTLLSLGPENGEFHALEPQLRTRFDAASRPLPGDRVPPQIAAAYERAGRAEPPKLGERRVWNLGTTRREGPTSGRLVQVVGDVCAVLDDDDRLDLVNGLTQEDSDYLNSVEGFHPVDATDEERSPAKPADTEADKRGWERLTRLMENRVDDELFRELDEILAYERRSGPYDPQKSQAYESAIRTLTSGLGQEDALIRDKAIRETRAAVAAGEKSQSAGDAEIAKLRESILDPTDESNGIEKSIAAWKASVPDSSIPWTIEAGALLAVAWTARGTGFAAEVTPEGWKKMEELLPRAAASIEEAAKRAPHDYYLRRLQLSIGRAAGYDAEKIREVFYAGLEGNPEYRGLIDEMVFTLLPRWSGQSGEVGRLAAELMDNYGDAKGTAMLNHVVELDRHHEGGRLFIGEFPPEPLARAARYMAEHDSDRLDKFVRAEVLAFVGGDFQLAWELKRRTLRSQHPALEELRLQVRGHNWSIDEFYERLNGPPDVRRVRRIDFENPDAPPPTMAFADSNRVCLIFSDDGYPQAIDVFAMKPDETFVPSEAFSEVRYLTGASDRWLAGVGVDEEGKKRVVRFDARGEFEPVPMRRTESFPAVVAMSPFGERIAGGGYKPEESLTFWDASTGEVQGEATMPFPVRSALFAPDGARVAVWDGERRLAFVDANSRKIGETIELPGPCHFPQFVASGALAFLRRSGDATEPRWNAVAVDPETGAVEELSTSWASDLSAFGDVEFADDLSCAFVIEHPDAAMPDVRIFAVDLKTGETLAALDGHFRTVLQLKYRGDFQRLYSVGADRHLMEWDVSPEGLMAARANDAK